MIPGLQARRYDVIISSMSMTDERKKVIDFSDKYHNTPSRVVVKSDVKVDEAFGGLRAEARRAQGSTQEKFALGELSPKGATIVPYEAQDQVYLDIKSGRLDGTVADSVEVGAGFLGKPEGQGLRLRRSLARRSQYFKYFGSGMGVAMRKGRQARVRSTGRSRPSAPTAPTKAQRQITSPSTSTAK